jgi:DNA-binding winged helix-turn-helix (wHTH) protein
MQHNEFQRRLNDAHLSEQAMYLLSFLYESHNEVVKQQTEIGHVLLSLANTIQNFIVLNEKTLQELRKVQRHGMTDGVEVHSVLNDPEDN